MNEPEANYAVSMLNLTDRLNRENDEWEWQMKMDKIEQMHDFMGEREQEFESLTKNENELNNYQTRKTSRQA